MYFQTGTKRKTFAVEQFRNSADLLFLECPHDLAKPAKKLRQEETGIYKACHRSNLPLWKNRYLDISFFGYLFLQGENILSIPRS